MPASYSPAHSTLINFAPLDRPIGEHLGGLVHGHAELLAAIVNHANAHDQAATPGRK